jgi:hypothetical protein
MEAIAATGLIGFVGHEFTPTAQDRLKGLN